MKKVWMNALEARTTIVSSRQNLPHSDAHTRTLMYPYTETTQGVTVTVKPIYLDGRSSFFSRRFVFAYFIEIRNDNSFGVQLLHREWLIRNAHGVAETVKGEGVVGQQPFIESGKTHRYNSFCVLATFEGTMEGFYSMIDENGQSFRVAIPRFSLRAMAN